MFAPSISDVWGLNAAENRTGSLLMTSRYHFYKGIELRHDENAYFAG